MTDRRKERSVHFDLDLGSTKQVSSQTEAKKGGLPLFGDSRGSLHRAANEPQSASSPCAWRGGANLIREANTTRMPLDKQLKSEVIANYAVKEGDTGSTELQIALLQARITQITDHLRTHRKDFHSRRGLLLMVGRRRRLEAYLRSRDIVKYRELIKRLGIREVRPR